MSMECVYLTYDFQNWKDHLIVILGTVEEKNLNEKCKKNWLKFNLNIMRIFEALMLSFDVVI